MPKRDETGHGVLRVAGAALAATIAGGQVPLAVPKAAGGQCPSGYTSGAHYCAPMPGTRRQAIRKAGSCPPNWTASGGYCLSPVRPR